MKITFLAAGVAVLLMGCATAGGLKSEPLDQGVTRSFTGTYDTILKAARDAVVDSGLHLEASGPTIPQ